MPCVIEDNSIKLSICMQVFSKASSNSNWINHKIYKFIDIKESEYWRNIITAQIISLIDGSYPLNHS